MRPVRLSALVILPALAGAALLWASARPSGEPLLLAGAAAGKPQQEGVTGGEAAATDQLRRGHVRPALHNALDALGDRMVRPGKERVVLTATVTRRDEEAAAIYLIREFPGRLRVEEQGRGVGRGRSLVFDGRGARASDGDVSREDEELVETLVYDSAEYFFQGQLGGAATRFLGPGYRLDESESFEHDGPTYDVYEVTEQIQIAGDGREHVKRYYFNSMTRLLEWVKYEGDRGGAPVRVAVQLGNWLEVQGQRVPGRIVRTVDGETVIDLRVTSAGFAPRAEDGVFGFPRN